MSWDPDTSVIPGEERDQEEQAKAWYDEPTRARNRLLEAENLRLKKLLRENGISWDPRLTLDPDDLTRGSWSSPKRSRTRKSKGSMSLSPQNSHLPMLPVEIQLYILEYALTSKTPIIDPLSKSNRDTLSAAERTADNQIAIGFLATCKAYLIEGTRFLWNNNTFIFTSHVALRNFANLSLEHRKGIKYATFRIIARYYDDEERKHLAPYPSTADTYAKTINLKTTLRIKEENLARKGFRSYTWEQVVDFLDAMRPPFDPHHPKGQPRPRLLPGLETLRMDFVNFPDSFLSPGSGSFLHSFASHDLGCTLNELQLTGLPACDLGDELVSELSGMVKDEGLVLKSDATYVYSGNQLRQIEKPPKGQRLNRWSWMTSWDPKVVRSWKALADEYARSKNKPAAPQPSHAHHRHSHAGHHRMPPAPKEEGHPESPWKERRTLFKRVPRHKHSGERIWVEFDRLTGLEIDPLDYDEEDDEYDISDLVCPHCDVMHPPSGEH
ncbi:hypothetical protein CHGG_04380 [Chaetomium globosum CBS 148.51]|jgi:hypothetical protein|uniref:Uncharacterized protein n=1 Tax=Chaetomium globosum (strain ATCC 6205 / CBS 148.51 / DSM 1962 / NBRC 6347 / NRRL 1970) TaxID=306901 RepID=Q2H1G6_CHAGB|nr:uncharacterized protein CHGG_04380 [Chaetomium globosum CBS 148.51]EAQ87761.1 hypothetical protein CHGG_04380 [Chaetomium globosum CBS 148.51]